MRKEDSFRSTHGFLEELTQPLYSYSQELKVILGIVPHSGSCTLTAPADSIYK